MCTFDDDDDAIVTFDAVIGDAGKMANESESIRAFDDHIYPSIDHLGKG